MRMLFNILLGLAILGAVAAGGLAVYVRTASDDPAEWHVDPETAGRTGNPNDVLIGPAEAADSPSPAFKAPPRELMAAVDSAMLALPRTERLAGSVDGLSATYVQRTALMAYPDYVSVKVQPAEGGSTLAIWSRSRFGRSDFGVNAARVSALLEALEPLQQ